VNRAQQKENPQRLHADQFHRMNDGQIRDGELDELVNIEHLNEEEYQLRNRKDGFDELEGIQ
jgi:hypothetical protein